jgi:microcystin degradation protein MlrC
MRIAVGSFVQESHSFSPVPGSWEHFGPREVLRGVELLKQRTGTRSEIGGAIQIAQQHDLQLVPLLSALSTSSAGPILRTVFESLRDELVKRLLDAGPIDGLFLTLHGGMIAEGYEDASGEIIRALRTVVGPELPLICTLDLHANVTRQMTELATALIGYHTFPHVDLYETGQRGMSLLVKIVSGQCHPAMAMSKIPMILPGENGRTTHGPFAEVMNMVEALQQSPSILDASAFSVQPWLDVSEVGCSVVVIADGDRALAKAEADRLAQAFWERRAQFAVQLTPTIEAIRLALHSNQHPFVFSDSADSPSSGAPGDSPAILQALLEVEPSQPCFLNIVDAPAVEQAIQVGVGQQVTFQVGARNAPQFYRPIEITGTVKLIADGEFVHKGQGYQGIAFHRGRTVVIKSGWVSLVVSEHPAFQWDPEFYRSLGLEPRDAQIVVVKSPAAFRANYEPFAVEVLILDAPGVCSPDLNSFPFQHVRRPLYPLDDFQDWRLGTDYKGK